MNDKFCKYDPDVKLFKEIGKAQLNVSGNQYRITFDGKQMNLKLGDLVSCSGIDNGGRFVVVDVHSVYEKEDVADNPKIVNRMEVTVVPEISKDFAIPLPVDDNIKSYGSLRGSSNPYMGSKSNDASGISIRTATVDDSLDPYRMNQVKVTYEGDTYPSAEWVKVLTPFASKGNGISCKLVEGDKVLVCTIKTPTKEESFVVGSYYEGKDNTPPNRQRKFSTIIRSKNGQYIGFEESNDKFDFLGGFLPDGIRRIIEAIYLNNNETWDAKEGSNTYNALGGIEMSDTNGLFTIAGSSSKRSITISSPFGTVGIDAAMGITISAPNGDIKIVGKNIDIEAGNNLTLKSGTNIDSSYVQNSFWKTVGSNLGNSMSNSFSNLFDFPALRFFVEFLFKPIAGTLKVHSGRNLLLEADGTDAHFQDHAFSVQNHYEIVEYKDIKDIKDKIKTLVDTITKRINSFKTYKALIVTEYKALRVARQHIYDDIMRNCNSKNGDDVKILLSKDLNTLIDNNLAPGENNLKDHLVVRNGVTDADTFITKISKDINSLKTQLNDFNVIDTYGKSNVDDDDFRQYFKAIRKSVNQTDLNYGDSELEDKLFVTLDTQKKNLRLYVKSAIVADEKFGFGYVVDEDSLENDEEWIKMIDSIELKKTRGETVLTGLANMGLDILNKILPIESVNTFMWRQEDKGKILMSQHVDSTLSINGQTLKEEFDGTSLASVREAMRNATL